MVKSMPLEITKIKKIVADIHEFSANIDSAEVAKKARKLLRKYALLSEKIERNVLIRATHQKDLANLRTKEFKSIRRTLKENANSILYGKNTKSAHTEKPTKKPTKIPAAKKTSKVTDEKVAKKPAPKKTIKKASPKPRKATASKEGG
jgi:hypothetical protein